MYTLKKVLSLNTLKQSKAFCFEDIDPLVIYWDYSFAIISEAKSIATLSLTHNFIRDVVKDLNFTIVVARYYLQRLRGRVPLYFTNGSTMVIVMCFF